jgi:hypothetical protein
MSHKGVFNVSSLSTREGSDGSSNAPRKWYSDLQSEKRASLLQEGHLNWPNNQITNNRKTVAEDAVDVKNMESELSNFL